MTTKEKILDTAEQLFAEHGYSATSMRQIIAAAEVNLAAIHYHFGSKEELLDAVVHRRAEPVNADRLARLDAAQANGGGPPAVDQVLEALLRPMAAVAIRNRQFVRFMGRVHTEGLLPQVARKHFGLMMVRFVEALHAALPELPEPELRWRVHFMMGAIAHTMCQSPEGLNVLEPDSGFDQRIDRLKRFLAAGFRAPGE